MIIFPLLGGIKTWRWTSLRRYIIWNTFIECMGESWVSSSSFQQRILLQRRDYPLNINSRWWQPVCWCALRYSFDFTTNQGFLGWYMVKSGLTDSSDKDPKVSPLRLTMHLGCALSIYILLLNTGLDMFMPKMGKYIPNGRVITLQLCNFLVILTAMSGMLVSAFFKVHWLQEIERGRFMTAFPKWVANGFQMITIPRQICFVTPPEILQPSSSITE